MSHRIFLFTSLVIALTSNNNLTAQNEYYTPNGYLTTKNHNSHNQLKIVNTINKRNASLSLRNKKTHRLDSLHYYSTGNGQHGLRVTRKDVFSYSDSMETVKVYGLDFDWFPSNILKYQLNSSGQVSQYSFHPNWNGSDLAIDTLPADIIETYSYNNENLLSSIERRATNPFGLEKARLIFTYEYDSLQQLVSEKLFLRNLISDTLAISLEYLYSYLGNSNLESIVEYRFTNSLGFVARDSIHFIYNDQRHLVEKQEFFLNADSSWFQNFNHLYTYNESGKTNEIKIQGFDGNNNTAVPFCVIEDFWHSENELTQIFGDKYENGTFQGEAYGYEWRYNTEVDNDLVQYPIMLQDLEDLNKMIISEDAYNFGLVPLEINFYDYRYDYFYRILKPSSLNEINSDTQLVYPCPAQDYIILELPMDSKGLTITLFNLNGVSVHHERVSETTRIDISTLPAGLYVYKIASQDVDINGKIVLN